MTSDVLPVCGSTGMRGILTEHGQDRMRKSRLTEEQIRLAVEQATAGVTADEPCREYVLGRATFRRWRAKYGGVATWTRDGGRRIRPPESG